MMSFQEPKKETYRKTEFENQRPLCLGCGQYHNMIKLDNLINLNLSITEKVKTEEDLIRLPKNVHTWGTKLYLFFCSLKSLAQYTLNLIK